MIINKKISTYLYVRSLLIGKAISTWLNLVTLSKLNLVEMSYVIL